MADKVAEMQRARSAPFPLVDSQFEWGDVFSVKVHYGRLVQIFPLWIPAKTKGSKTYSRLPAIGKHALSWINWRRSSRNGASAKCTFSQSS